MGTSAWGSTTERPGKANVMECPLVLEAVIQNAHYLGTHKPAELLEQQVLVASGAASPRRLQIRDY